MFVKEVKADFLGHQIAVRNSWGPSMSLKGFWTECKLYIDGNVADTNSDAFMLSKTAAILRGSIRGGDKAHVVEVYAISHLRTKIKICGME